MKKINLFLSILSMTFLFSCSNFKIKYAYQMFNYKVNYRPEEEDHKHHYEYYYDKIIPYFDYHEYGIENLIWGENLEIKYKGEMILNITSPASIVKDSIEIIDVKRIKGFSVPCKIEKIEQRSIERELYHIKHTFWKCKCTYVIDSKEYSFIMEEGFFCINEDGTFNCSYTADYDKDFYLTVSSLDKLTSENPSGYGVYTYNPYNE